MRSATFGAAILIAPSPAGIHSANAGSVSVASFYAGGEKLNRPTANGEVFKPGGPDGSVSVAATRIQGRRNQCAHRSSVVVRVNDRGPAVYTGRLIDLSRGAYQRIASLSSSLISATIKKAER
jgi:rare lipoprotein A